VLSVLCECCGVVIILFCNKNRAVVRCQNLGKKGLRANFCK
jgi:hypothetical protein